jgi:hypothetical protein
MPRIEDRFLDCSVYLYKTEEHAVNGASVGGSGFLAAIPGFGADWLIGGRCPQPDFYHCYAVTNRHVAEKRPVVRLNREQTSTSGSRTSVIPFTVEDWTCSADHDIAVAPIRYEEDLKYLFIAREKFLTVDKAARYDVGIGDEVFMVGRFINHEGKQVNNPSVRWGNISMMPVDVADDPDHPNQKEQGFVVESRSIPGYSGSPVFVRPFPTPKLMSKTEMLGAAAEIVANTVVYTSCIPSSPRDRNASESVSGGPWLLGIQRAYIHFIDPEDQVKKNTGMSCVVPAWYILELLNTEKMVAQRRAEQERLRDRHEQATTPTPQDAGAEWDEPRPPRVG